jgi:hypothetical protein
LTIAACFSTNGVTGTLKRYRPHVTTPTTTSLSFYSQDLRIGHSTTTTKKEEEDEVDDDDDLAPKMFL